jgi:Secretion system C-terminal sorting domain
MRPSFYTKNQKGMKFFPVSSRVIAHIFLLCLFVAKSGASNAQVYSYTNDSVGNYNTVATNATATGLGRINGATAPTPACRHGFSSKGFPTTATFATGLAADTVSVAPASGYVLHVTGFSVGLRRSSTGPDSARLAYTTNGGTTWVDQGYAFAPSNFGCDTVIFAAWARTVTVSAPFHLEFAVFGYKASSTSGTFQIDTLTIDGTVTSTTSILSERIENDNNFTVFPNPAKEVANVAYHLSKPETVSVSVYNIVGQEVSLVKNVVQGEGDYHYSVSIAAPGMYFVKLAIGDAVFTRKIMKE